MYRNAFVLVLTNKHIIAVSSYPSPLVICRQLIVPRIRRQGVGNCAFGAAAARMWINLLPTLSQQSTVPRNH